MAEVYSVRVEHGDEEKNEVFSEELGSQIVFVQEKFDDSVQAVGGRNLSGMHSRGEENNHLIISESGRRVGG